MANFPIIDNVISNPVWSLGTKMVIVKARPATMRGRHKANLLPIFGLLAMNMYEVGSRHSAIDTNKKEIRIFLFCIMKKQ